MCAFAAFGGIFFGFDSGYINGVLAMPYFVHTFEGEPYPLEVFSGHCSSKYSRNFAVPAWRTSLIVSILSAGTFFGARKYAKFAVCCRPNKCVVLAGDLADFCGRRTTIILGCLVFMIGVILQTAATAYGLLIAGRLIAGLGVGFVSAIIILYMSELAPRKVRGAIVSGYQFCITIGLLLASCVVYATQCRFDSGSYRIPIAIQLVWALILGSGLCFLPESPRYVSRPF